MRDINRIEPFCKELAEIWKAAPDMRFGQFISNILGEIYQKNGVDPYYLEEDDFLSKVKEIHWIHLS